LIELNSAVWSSVRQPVSIVTIRAVSPPTPPGRCKTHRHSGLVRRGNTGNGFQRRDMLVPKVCDDLRSEMVIATGRHRISGARRERAE
jgi:hypothetical protein